MALAGNASHNLIAGNIIGLGADGTTVLGSATDGIDIWSGSTNNTIGGTAPFARNIISGNTRAGITLDGVTGTQPADTIIEGNYIGTDITGTLARPNAFGIYVYGANDETIGGTTASARNVISSNSDGILLQLAGATNNTISGNYIGTQSNGSLALPNNVGVTINMSAAGNTIGGAALGAGNVISGNSGDGVDIFGAGDGNVVQGDFLGTDGTGVVLVPNGSVDLDGVSYTGTLTVAGTTLGGALDVAAAGGTLVLGADTAGSINVGAASVDLAGSLTSTGAMMFTGPVSLLAASTLASSGGGDITFAGTVDGPFALAVNTAGVATFDGAVGAAAPLTQFSAAAVGQTFLGAGVTTTGDLTINDPLILTANVTLTDAGAAGAGITLFSADSDSTALRTLTIQTNLSFTALTEMDRPATGPVTAGHYSQYVTLGAATPVTSLTVTANADTTEEDFSNVAVPVTVDSTSTAIQDVVVTSSSPTQTASGTLTIITSSTPTVTTVNLADDTTPVTVTPASSTIQNVVVTNSSSTSAAGGALIIVTPETPTTTVVDLTSDPTASTVTVANNFSNVLVTGTTPTSAAAGSLTVVTNLTASATTTVNLAGDQAAVTVTVGSSPTPVVVLGDPVNNTFQMTGTQGNDVTFEGGTGLNLYVPDPSGGFNVTLIDPAALSNTIDLTKAFLPTSASDKASGSVQQIGVTLDLNSNTGQKQFVYSDAATDPDIGSLIDPSLLASNSGDSISLFGVFPAVILGSGATLFTASTSYDAAGGVAPGTNVALMGTGNTVYGAPGSVITSQTGGNTVIQNFDSAQADAFLVAGNSSAPSAATTFLTSGSTQTIFFGTTGVQQSLVASNATVQDSLLTGSSYAQSLLAGNPAVASLLQNNAAVINLLQSNSSVAALLIDNTGVANLLAGNSAVASLLQNNPAVATLLENNPAVANLLATRPWQISPICWPRQAAAPANPAGRADDRAMG